MKLIRTLLRSLRLYLVIMFPYRRWHFRFTHHDIDIREEHLTVEGRPLAPDIYRAHRGPAVRPAILIYVPLAQEGKRDAIIVNFMEGLAHLGYVVMVPFWPGRDKGTIATTDQADFIACLDWLRAQPDVDPQRIGVVAVSYGVAPILNAIADETTANKIQFLSLIGGVADMKNLAEFALTGRFSYQNIHGTITPDPYIGQILLRAAAAYVTRPTDKDYFLALANGQSVDGVELSPEGQRIADLFASRTATQFATAYANLPPRMRAWLTDLSPITRLSGIHTPILIMHSTNDALVPYTESLRLADGLRHNRHTTLTLVSVFDHTVPVAATPWNLLRIYLPNLGRIVRYIHRILAFQEQ